MISLVIPIYNEQGILEILYERIKVASAGWNQDYEVIFIDDGSSDYSLEIIQKLNQKDDRVKAISFSRNFGHQTAVSAGLKYSTGEIIVVMDGDLQDPPEQIINFLEQWQQGYQVVYAIRKKRKEAWYKKLAYYSFYRLLNWMSSVKIPLDSGDFCLLDRTIVDHLNSLPERNRFVRGLRAWIGYKQIGIPYERNARLAGEAKYTFRKLIRLAFDGLINFSYRPLQVFTSLGIIVSLLSFLVAIYYLFAWILDPTVREQLPGYTSIIIAILFLGGVQLISIGILGEYIGRIFDEVKARPLFIISQKIGIDQ
ncbi:glycosyltransferase family 2 protein [Dactylococcopsis salina]|uniref:Glycosyl transferase n=1 Tax=Dactylococcopsis salina (strain PCC 8305) TaxID=13035 RepID=K9YYU9_DACS8|nr:glycosyltransferase family 2 protein [Dactylococcopsis salina]AFZ52099.1 glycosyl transferase [Dactylococcopsis salina PCC 8305]